MWQCSTFLSGLSGLVRPRRQKCSGPSQVRYKPPVVKIKSIRWCSSSRSPRAVHVWSERLVFSSSSSTAASCRRWIRRSDCPIAPPRCRRRTARRSLYCRCPHGVTTDGAAAPMCDPQDDLLADARRQHQPVEQVTAEAEIRTGQLRMAHQVDSAFPACSRGLRRSPSAASLRRPHAGQRRPTGPPATGNDAYGLLRYENHILIFDRIGFHELADWSMFRIRPAETPPSGTGLR